LINYLVGKPRSGKTYEAVYILNGHLEKKSYGKIFLNINGFKSDNYPVVEKIRYDDFFEVYLKELHTFYKKVKRNHEDYDILILAKLKEDGYLSNKYNPKESNSNQKTFLVIDECQEYLGSQRVAISWFFSYHGHLGFDLLLITQAIGLVHTKYKYTIETCTSSAQATFKLTDKYFTYRIYGTTKMGKNDLVETYRRKKDPKIFALYKSGDRVKFNPFVFKKLFFIVILLFVLYFYYSYFMDSMKKSSSSSANSSNSISSVQKLSSNTKDNTEVNEVFNDDFKYLFLIKCYKQKCSLKNKFSSVPYHVFMQKKDINFKIIEHIFSPYGQDIYIEASDSFLIYYNKFNKFNPKKDKKGLEFFDK